MGVHYRGVPQDQVINALINACDLVHKNSPGPECDSIVDRILASVSYLQSITDDKEFLSAVQSADVLMIRRMQPLFENYSAENTDGIGEQVLQGLHAWGAFGVIHYGLMPIDEEIRRYCFINGLRRIKAVNEDEVVELLAERFGKFDKEYIASGVADFVEAVSIAQRGATDAKLAKLYYDLGVGRAQGQLVRVAVEEFSKKPFVVTKPLFSMYGIQLADTPPGETFDDKAVKKNNAALIDSINKFLTPFLETDEVQMFRMTALGGITRDLYGPQGIIFNVTEHVAQAVANAFPKLQVLHESGRVITPVAPNPAQNNNPTL